MIVAVVVIIGLFVTSISYYGITRFPSKDRQFLASIPLKRNEDGSFQGLNVTTYGLMNGIAYTFGTSIFLFLSSSSKTDAGMIILSVLVILLICIPASKIVATIVEKKYNTFTVSGGSFVGGVLSPIIFYIFLYLHYKDSNIALSKTLILLGAISTAYLFGEGLGRLGCLSFGCCYGSRVDSLKGGLKIILSKFYTKFYGDTKKVAYEGGLEGEKTVPVQTIAVIFLNSISLFSTILFLNEFFISSFLLSVISAQLFRFFSEFLRSDFRGNRKITVYQIFSIIIIFYSIAVAYLLNRDGITQQVDLEIGLSIFYNVWVLVLLQAIFWITLIYTGISRVTYSKITFHVDGSKI